MIIPKLDKSVRNREYNSYNNIQRAKVLHGFLFEGKAHRTLDKDILGKDPTISKGWQSMGILHYLGLKKEFRGLFINWDINDANINCLNDKSEYQYTYNLIKEHILPKYEIDLKENKLYNNIRICSLFYLEYCVKNLARENGIPFLEVTSSEIPVRY